MALALSHPSSLGHDTGTHPERAARLATLEATLASRDWLGWEHVNSPAVDRDVLELVHPAAYVAAIEAAARRAAASGGRVAIDSDTVVSADSFAAARHGVGGAVELVRRLVGEGGNDPDADGDGDGDGGRDAGGRGGHRVGFSLHRPPGHHAPADRAMGFCLFNSVAVAARYATQVLGVGRVAIVDWDVHHGNGTQDIFWDSERVLFCSIHQMPLYPGSGRASETGAGAGAGLTLNLPVAPGSGDREFLERLEGPVSDALEAFGPELLLISAGFDAHVDDPLAACTVSDRGFAAMGAWAREQAHDAGVPLALVLEGGYDVDALSRSVLATMEAVAP